MQTAAEAVPQGGDDVGKFIRCAGLLDFLVQGDKEIFNLYLRDVTAEVRSAGIIQADL
ncbi:MAG: hypothetical protein II932_07670 [Treponema sp.]|nr:hypothetical protein [Treponema sp.]